jgi:hypothetical protein
VKIRRDFQQGTPEWRAARLGKITASEVSRAITPAKLDRSKSRDAYMDELAAERVLGMACDSTTDGWRERGTALEVEARDWFCVAVADVEQVGFIEHDNLALGCSPDGISEGKFGLEVKAPSAKVHAGYVRKSALLVADYRLQVQMGLWVTGWPKWYLLSYCPGMTKVVREVRPEPECFKAFEREIPHLLLDVEALEAMLRKGA